MKKLFISILYSFFFLFQIFSQSIQNVFPKTIFTGDNVEIRYIFHSDANIFTDEIFNSESSRVTLKTDYPFFMNLSDRFVLRNAILDKIGSEYTLSLKLTPWKAGYIVIPPFDLNSYVRYSFDKADDGVQYVVELNPIEVNSFIEKNQITSFRPQKAPAVMPGTTLYLTLAGILILALSAAVFTMLMKLPFITRTLEKLNYIRSLKRNSRKAVKTLQKLLKSSPEIPDDKDFAGNLQKILRAFLLKRFSRDFSSVSTSAFYSHFIEIAGGDLSRQQDEAVETLIELFFRTDYIRYSSNSSFEAGERQKLIEKSINMIQLFDAEEEKDEEMEESC